MTDEKDDPTFIPDGDLEDAQGGMKIPNIFSGDSKIVNSFDLGTQDLTIDAKHSKDDLLIQNIGFPDSSKTK